MTASRLQAFIVTAIPISHAVGFPFVPGGLPLDTPGALFVALHDARTRDGSLPYAIPLLHPMTPAHAREINLVSM